MKRRLFRPVAVLLPALALLSACHGNGGADNKPGATVDKLTNRFAGIGEEETFRFTGTEPFWGGSVTGGTLLYTTPENPEGKSIAVTRAAGNNGLGFSGEMGGKPFDMAVSLSECSDGMSDRTYPFTVTLTVLGEQRGGCGWTAAHPFRDGPAAPSGEPSR